MTRDEILKMEAGREMDALIAEKVMGWKIETVANHYGGTMYMTEQNGCRHFFRFVRDDVYSGERAFMPSTDISAAWEVVEKMGAYKLESVFRSSGTKQKAIFWHGMIAYSAEAETSSLAICRASLLTILDK